MTAGWEITEEKGVFVQPLINNRSLKITNLQLTKQSWRDHPIILQKYIEDHQPRSILEIGAGPNPCIDQKIIGQNNIDYHLNDYASSELNKGNNNYKIIAGDFLDVDLPQNYDFIISQMVLEHVSNPREFHKKIYDHLNPGGIAIHFFATLYSAPAVLNLILPEFISDKLVKWVQNRDAEFHGKFPAKYHWCRGPIKGYHEKFEQIGFTVLEQKGYVGHGYLSTRKNLYKIEKLYSKMLLKLNNPLFCSNTILVLKKEKCCL